MSNLSSSIQRFSLLRPFALHLRAENKNMARKKSNIGCLFWVALILLVLVVFLFNRKTIETVLDRTGLLQYITRSQDADEMPETVRRVQTPEEDVSTRPRKSPDPAPPEPEPPSKTETKDRIVVKDEPETSEPQESPSPAPEIVRSEKLRRSTLYFVSVAENGAIGLQPVVRPVYYVDSPLTDTLQTLLQGLSTSELDLGLLSLVPKDSELKKVWVEDGTAFVDFNESFRFNAFGREGYRSQLQQIVYTATEFQTVRNVQILINGKKLPYLGPESPFIGEPLSRQSL